MSIKRTSVNNIAISAMVAALSYISLVMIGRIYGGTISNDAYFFLISLVTLSSGLITCLYSVTLLPSFIDIKINKGLVPAERFSRTVLSLSSIVVVPVALLCFIFGKDFYSLVTKFNDTEIEQTTNILRYFPFILVVTVFYEYLKTLVIAMGGYTLAASCALFQPIVLILFLGALRNNLGGEVLSIGLLVARGLGLLPLLYGSIVVYRLSALSPAFSTADIRRFSNVSAPYWSASVVTNAALFYFDYTLTGLGAGVLSSVQYAQKIFVMPGNIFIAPIVEIVRVKFAEARSNRDMTLFSKYHKNAMSFILYFTVPIAMLFYYFSSEIILVLFGSKSFSPGSITVASTSLSVYSLAIPLSAMFMLNGRAVEVFQRLKWPSLIGSIGHFALIYVTYILVNIFGYIGVPLSKLLMEFLYFLPFGFISLHLFKGGGGYSSLLRVAVIAIVGSAVSLLIIIKIGLWAFASSHFGTVLTLIMMCSLYSITYILIILAADKQLRYLWREPAQ